MSGPVSYDPFLSETESLSAVQQEAYLDRYGYLSEGVSFDTAVKRLQKMGLLVEDGVVGPKTASLMNLPRCGMPEKFSGEPEAAKWPLACEHLPTAQQLAGLRGLTADQIALAWLAAIRAWNAVCSINMYVSDWAAAKIYAVSASLSGSTLADSYLANNDCGSRLRQRYNTNVNWTFDFLVGVMVHEIGHALGLGHSSSVNDIMYPIYNRKFTSPQPGDIQRVRVLGYGPPAGPVPPLPVPPTPPGYLATFTLAGTQYGIVPVVGTGGVDYNPVG